ncbi:MAG: acetylxylan esterase [Bacteroidales bacterium]|nr:acetylxylan esterase [Bacteroidales bacterium]
MKQMIYSVIRKMPGLLKIIFTLSLAIFLTNDRVKGQNEIDVIRNNWLEYSDASNSLYHYLTGQAYVLLEQRARKIAELHSLDSWQQRQKYIRETIMDIVGPFPEKTPLNAKTLRIIDKDSYRIEHIVYESQPGFYVTSSMYIPARLKRSSKLPAVIYCSGHSIEGYRSAVYQHVILNLVNKGFIVFAFDPVGQGERLEYYDKKAGKSLIGGPTKEHSYPGAQAFITGSSQARYMIWDGIRAVDYLLTRREADPAKIGITGRSGGGTQSAYIAAIDDRIYAAAPENYITSYTRLLQTIGPQDAEQNMFNLIQRGLDHPDFLIIRAPKPTLMITTTNDMFSIQGAIETEKDVSGIYKAYGKEENFSRVEDDAAHASTVKNREAMYAFFQKHLNNPGNPCDEETQPLAIEELQVTKTGQVSTSMSGETVFSLNRRVAENLTNQLNTSRDDPDVYLPEVISSAKKLSGYQEPAEISDPVFAGRIQRDNYVIEKYFIKGAGDYIIPYLLFKPEKPDNRAMIYLHPSGKSAEALKGDEIEWFVGNGFTVLAPDLVGTGEMGPGILRGDAYFEGASHNLWYASMLIGRSITGIQAGDVVRLTRLLKKYNEATEIFGFARKEMAPVLLHAAAFTSELTSIVLFEPYSSYLSIVMNRYYNPVFINSTVPAALTAYDLPDLAASLAPRKLFMADVTDGFDNTTDTLNINKDIAIVKAAYQYRQANGQLNIVTGESIEKIYVLLKEWLNKK